MNQFNPVGALRSALRLTVILLVVAWFLAFAAGFLVTAGQVASCSVVGDNLSVAFMKCQWATGYISAIRIVTIVILSLLVLKVVGLTMGKRTFHEMISEIRTRDGNDSMMFLSIFSVIFVVSVVSQVPYTGFTNYVIGLGIRFPRAALAGLIGAWAIVKYGLKIRSLDIVIEEMKAVGTNGVALAISLALMFAQGVF